MPTVVVAAAVIFVVGLVAASGAVGARLGVWIYGPPEAMARVIHRRWLHGVALGLGLLVVAAVLALLA